jgi:hypothetical protein
LPGFFACGRLHHIVHVDEIPLQALVSENPFLFKGIVPDVVIERLSHNDAPEDGGADIFQLVCFAACPIAREIALLRANP